MPIFIAREMEEEDALKEETLIDYLQEYESQSWRFKEHLNFQGFFQIKENRRPKNHNRSIRGRFFLPNFDGSSKCTAKDWIEQLDSYLQLHQVSEKEVLRIAAVHLECKAYVTQIFGHITYYY